MSKERRRLLHEGGRATENGEEDKEKVVNRKRRCRVKIEEIC